MGCNRWYSTLFLIYALAATALIVGFLVGTAVLYKWGLETNFKGRYNETVAHVHSPPQGVYETITLFVHLAVGLFIMFALTKSKIDQNSPRKITKAVLQDIAFAGLHYSFMYILMEIIEMALGVPQPYFLGYKKLICTENGSLPVTPSTTEVDSMCQTFPSFFSATTAFWSTYLYLYLKHLKISFVSYSVYYTTTMVIWFCCLIVLFSVYNDKQIGLGDIGLGALFGVITAICGIQTKRSPTTDQLLLNLQLETKIYVINPNEP